ncbi:hypothetical protein BDC45DRAFT_499009, partial [Circinella umbellata]
MLRSHNLYGDSFFWAGYYSSRSKKVGYYINRSSPSLINLRVPFLIFPILVLFVRQLHLPVFQILECYISFLFYC